MQSEPHKGHIADPGQISDESLIERYNRGETWALTELVNRYRKPLYSFLWRMTGNSADSDEIFQDTWVRIITKSKGFRQDRFKGWIFKIAHNLVIDWSRRKGRTVSLDAPQTGGDDGVTTLSDRLADQSPSPDIRVDGKDIGRAIKNALSELPGEQREVFVLRMEAGMAFKDIAKMQGVSLNTALARMQYALVKMRKLLKDYHPDEGIN